MNLMELASLLIMPVSAIIFALAALYYVNHHDLN
jgi:hypothetical protein